MPFKIRMKRGKTMNKEEMERIRIESSAIGATAASNAHLLVSLIQRRPSPPAQCASSGARTRMALTRVSRPWGRSRSRSFLGPLAQLAVSVFSATSPKWTPPTGQLWERKRCRCCSFSEATGTWCTTWWMRSMLQTWFAAPP